MPGPEYNNLRDQLRLASGISFDPTAAGLPAGVTTVQSAINAVNTGWFNIKAYGAVGDGTARALSSVYSTLAAAQAVYPSAAALTEELDFNALRRAIESAVAAGGGTVWAPKGRYIMNNATSKNTGLVIPESTITGYTPAGTQVDIQGDSLHNTSFEWPVEPTTLKFLISCGNPSGTRGNSLGRYAASGMYEGLCKGFSIVGPAVGAETANLGIALTAVHGFGWGARRRMDAIEVRYCYVGVNIVGDHTLFSDVRTPQNYYGLYYDDPSQFLFGDLIHVKCMYTGCRMAAIGLHKNAYIGGKWDACYVGGAPYGFWKEAGAADYANGQRTWLGASFTNMQFEYIGNALVDEANASKVVELYGTEIHHSHFQWDNGHKLSAVARGAAIRCYYINSVTWRDIEAGFHMLPGDDAFVRATVISGLEFEGNVIEMLNYAVTAQKPFLHSDCVPYQSNVKLVQRGFWDGTFGFVTATSDQDVSAEYGASTQGILKGCVIDRYYDEVLPGAASSALPIAGIAATTQKEGWLIPLITKASGTIPVRVGINGSGVTVANNKFAKKAAGGLVVEATGPTDGVSVGWVLGPASDNGGGTNYRACVVKLTPTIF